jgi:hypothetical protein
MTTLFTLFGRSFQLASAVTPITPAGAFAATGSFTLQAGNILAIELKGEVSGVAIEMKCSWHYQLSGSTLTLGKIATATVLKVGLNLGGNPTNLPSLSFVSSADPNVGIALRGGNGTIYNWLRSGNRLPFALRLGTYVADLLLDSNAGTATHRAIDPAAAPTTWQDRFGSGPATSIGPTQALQIGDVVFARDSYELFLTPNAGALFLHADILDTAPTVAADNEMLFQYAAANGDLVVNGKVTDATSNVQWRGRLGGKPALVLFRHQDEHGGPLILQADAPMPISERAGTRSTPGGGSTAAQWNQTNAAMVVGTKAANGDLTISGAITALDTTALYDVMADPLRQRNDFDNPWFVQSGAVPVTKAPPREIHNVALNTYLAHDGSASPSASLVVIPHEVDQLTVFHLTSLHLADPTGWSLMSMRAERDLKPNGTGSGTAAAIGAYLSKSVSAKPVRLPAIDYAYSASNLAAGNRMLVPGGGTGPIPLAVQTHLDLLDQILIDSFDPPAMPVQRHVDGAGVIAGLKQYATLVDRIPIRARVDETGLKIPSMVGARLDNAPLHISALRAPAVAVVPVPTRLVFGGDDADVAGHATRLEQAADAQFTALEPLLRTFEPRWRAMATSAVGGSLAEKLRIRLAIPFPPATITTDLAVALIDAAIRLCRTSDNLADVTSDSSALGAYFDEIAPIEFEEAWPDLIAEPDPADGSVWFAPLLQHLWAPPDIDLLRRIVRFLLDVVKDSSIAPELDPLALLDQLVGTRDVAALTAIIDNVAQGVVQGVLDGLGEAWQAVADMWTQEASEVLDDLRKRYGPIFTPDVYRKLLEAEATADAKLLLDEIDRFLPIPINSLADLTFEPPEYLVRTTRFEVTAPVEPATSKLWRQAFDLCQTSVPWSFFLNDDATMILKLGRRRSLADILREVVRDYASATRFDPLGVADQLPTQVRSTDPSKLIDAFIATLDSDLLEPSWIGVFFVRPIADLNKDHMLCDLIGFDQIVASYVAVGGRAPDGPGGGPNLDIWAHIFKQASDCEPFEGDPRTVGHVELALTKFDVRIRQTKLSDAAIEVKIFPKDVWGKSHEADGSASKFPVIIIHGGLEPAGKDPNAPRDLVFAAIFPDKFALPVNLAFLKDISLAALRVARRGGATSIDIDGTIALQNPKQDLGIDLDLDGSDLDLTNFRIQLPSLHGMKVPVGALRKLDFDFPAVSFTLPNPRAVTVFGVEVIPTGLGYLRGSETEALDKLKSEFLWLRSFEAPPANSYIAHLTCEFDFGKNPQFGLIDARGLRFRTIFAATIENGSAAKSVELGMGGLDARDLKVSLFGVLSLEMERLRILPAELENKGATSKAGAILAENLSLKIFNWSPLPKGTRFDLMMLHPNDPGKRSDRRKGLLAFYDAEVKPTDSDAPDDGGETPEPVDDAFFKIHWLLLAHNMVLPAEALTYLLERGPDGTSNDYKGLFAQLLDKPDVPPKPSNTLTPLQLKGVDLLSEESWLFGISFRLKALFDRCSLVLHDQHYYGIHLWAEWVETVFGMKSIELAYVPGATRSEDRFRCNVPLPKLSFLGDLSLGEVALEWGFQWDFLVDIGFPWHGPDGYNWFRAFSIPVGAYEGKFGFYVEKRSTALAGSNEIELAAGVALYVGYFFGAGNSVAWVRAGIGVFGILEGRITFAAPNSSNPLALLRTTIRRIDVIGVVGIFAYGEGGVDVWILSARFRVSAQASCQVQISYVVNGPCTLSYRAEMAAGYSASVRVGSGWCGWTFRVSGHVQMPISGKLLLS